MGERDLRQHIIHVTVEMLKAADDPSALTVRQIAEHAEIGVGSINYYFGSKDNLIAESIWQMIGSVAADWYTPDSNSEVDAETRLRQLFKQSARVMTQYRKYMEIGIRHVIETGEMQAKNLILPLLREIVGETKSDIELRLLAFQLVTSLQVAFLNLEQLGTFLGVDVKESFTIDSIIDLTIDNLIGNKPEETRK